MFRFKSDKDERKSFELGCWAESKSMIPCVVRLIDDYNVADSELGWKTIDTFCLELLTQRLSCISQDLANEPQAVAREMITSERYERFKRSFGSGPFDFPLLPLEVPGLPEHFDSPEASISNSRMILQRHVIPPEQKLR